MHFFIIENIYCGGFLVGLYYLHMQIDSCTRNLYPTRMIGFVVCHIHLNGTATKDIASGRRHKTWQIKRGNGIWCDGRSGLTE